MAHTTKPADDAEDIEDSDFALAMGPKRGATSQAGQGDGPDGQFFIKESALMDLGLIDAPASPLNPNFEAESDFALAMGPPRGVSGNIADSFVVRGVYSPIPLTELRMDVAVNELLASLAFTDEGHTFAKVDILTKLEAMEQVPEVAHVLRFPDLIDDWSAQVWPMVLESMVNGESDGTSHLGVFKDLDIQDDDFVKDWIQMFGGRFSSEELESLYQIFAAAPTWEDLAASAIAAGSIHVRPADERSDSVFTRGWRMFKTGVEVMWNAPEVMAARMRSPRGNILTQSALYLDANDITSIEGRDKFFSWIVNETNEESMRIDRMQGGFDKFAARTVMLPVVGAKMLIKETALRMGDPNEYMWRQGLTFGQSLATGLGINPGDKYIWDVFTGAADAIVDIGLDPITFVAGLAGGMRNVQNIPRYGTRAEAIASAFRPSKSSKLGFGLFDRGMIPRMYWGFTSKHIDDFASSKKAMKTWTWIASTLSETPRIETRRFCLSKPKITPAHYRTIPQERPPGRDLTLT